MAGAGDRDRARCCRAGDEVDDAADMLRRSLPLESDRPSKAPAALRGVSGLAGLSGDAGSAPGT